MSEFKLTALSRTEFGKGAARRTRRAGRIPAVLYGHGTDPRHVSVPAHDVFMALKSSANALFELDMDGDAELALAKDVQRDPVRGDVEHVDFIIVKRGEKVEVEVPVLVVGESAPGTIHTLELQTIRLEAEATRVPQSVEIDITGLEAGSMFHTGDLKLPEGTTLAEDPELQVVNILIPRAETTAEEGEVEIAEVVED